MVASAMLVAFFVLRADLSRRSFAAGDSSLAELFIAIPCICGIVGARLYHVLETPHDLIADPWGQLFSRYGLAWFGGLLGGFAAWAVLAHRHKIPLLTSFDFGSPSAAIGYGVGRLGCFLSGDGDYGKPTNWHWPWAMSFPNGLLPTTQTCVERGWPSDCRVYPTPIYELMVAIVITWFLWKLGRRQIIGTKGSVQPGPVNKYPPGSVFAFYLILTGIARFLIEFIRINPPAFLGMTNAQTASLLSALSGLALLWWVRTTSA